MVYISYYQQPGPELIVQMKTVGNPADLAQAAERAIREVDTRLPVYDVRTMRESTALARTFVVMQSTFAGIFAVIALVLAATGIYGVMAYRTELRTHEIGIRVALGASRTDVMRLVLIQGMRLAAMGLALGLALSFGLTRFIRGLLYGIGANDPGTIFAVLLLLAAMSLLACFLPAWRAMRVNPVRAIREH
jgi:ABC-type antimicrobial peptide transport system permease subunit